MEKESREDKGEIRKKIGDDKEANMELDIWSHMSTYFYIICEVGF